MEERNMLNRMMKLSCLLAIGLFVTMFYPVPSSAEEDYDDYSENHDYANEYIENIVNVYMEDENYDVDSAQRRIDDLELVPEPLLKLLNDKEVNMYIIDFPIPNLDAFSIYKDKKEEFDLEGENWNGILGVQYMGNAAVLIDSAYHLPPVYKENEGVASVSIHELAHLIDARMVSEENRLSEEDEFIKIKNEEYQALNFRPSTMKEEKEYFAEGFAMFLASDEWHEEMKNKAPQTYEYFDTFVDRTILIEEEDDIHLSWGEFEDADLYEVYRDDELIGETTNLTFEDDSFASKKTVIYQVIGLDADGEELGDSFKRSYHTGDNDNIVIKNDQVILEEKNGDFHLSWEEATNVRRYEIYEDDQLLDETYGEEYVIEDGKEDATYVVKAVSSKGHSEAYQAVTVGEEETEAKEHAHQEQKNSFPMIGGLILLSLIALATLLFFIYKKRLHKG